MADDIIVRLASAATLQEAYAWRVLLEQEGIRCQVVGDYLTEGYGVGVPGMYPEVWIHRDDLEKARAILEAHSNRGALSC
jgi:hypothetical protein